MLDSESYKSRTDTDPQPRFATDAEIAIAEGLRRQIEERYLGRAAASGSSSSERTSSSR